MQKRYLYDSSNFKINNVFFPQNLQLMLFMKTIESGELSFLKIIKIMICFLTFHETVLFETSNTLNLNQNQQNS